MLRVLSLSTLFPSPERTGFGRFVARQFDALAKTGDIALTVINPVPLPFWKSGGAPHYGSNAYPVIHLPFRTIPRFGVRWNPALIARAVLPIARQLHAETPFDLVDAQFFYPDGPAAARIANALGLPLSIKARGSDIHYWGGQPFALTDMLAAADQADGLLTVSDALGRDMAALGMAANKISTHYTGLDHALFYPRPMAQARADLAQATGIPPDGRLLVTVGNLIRLKGQALVIDALAQLPHDVRLLLAGSGPDEVSLKRAAAALGLADRVHIPGGLAPDVIASALSAASAMVLPSQSEGLANAWIEALACGAPLVITDVGGACEVVQSTDAGRIIERNATSIASGIADLLASPPDRAATASHAARFSWEANAAQLAAHYQRLIDG